MSLDLDLSEVHRLTLDEYHQMIESGGLEDMRVELIEGLVVDMSPKSPEHENVVAWLAYWLFESLDRARFEVRVSAALTLARSEPEPDLIVFPPDAPRPYHPGSAALVIEVAVSSLRRDLITKARVYAGAGIDEYWVVDLEGRRVVRHRRPGPDGYRDVAEVGADGELQAASVDLPPLSVADVLAAARAKR